MNTSNRFRIAVVGGLAVLLAVGGLYRYGRSLWHPFYLKFVGKRTLQQAIARHGPAAEAPPWVDDLYRRIAQRCENVLQTASR